MAELAPFGALRYTPQAGQADRLVCPPYDIISEEQRQNYLRRDPHNVIRLELPREGDDPYARAGEILREWLADGVLACDETDALYVYEVEFTHRGQRRRLAGVIGRVKLEPFSTGVILPHEETLSKAKEDRLHLMNATGCNFSQIYCLYHDEDGVTAGRLAACRRVQPALELTDDEGLVHRLWVVTDPTVIAAVCSDFADRRLTIADGHHRYETALRYRDEQRAAGRDEPALDWVMTMLVDMENPGLVVYPTHRVVRDLPRFDEPALLDACRPYFDLRGGMDVAEAQTALDAAYAAGKTAFALYAGNAVTLMTLRDPAVMAELLPHAGKALRGLDVSVLHALVLERVLGIDRANMAAQRNLTYTRDAQEALTAVDEGRANACFLLNPTRVEEIRDVAAAGEKMPQKSTYFYPKLITGLVMNRMI